MAGLASVTQSLKTAAQRSCLTLTISTIGRRGGTAQARERILIEAVPDRDPRYPLLYILGYVDSMLTHTCAFVP